MEYKGQLGQSGDVPRRVIKEFKGVCCPKGLNGENEVWTSSKKEQERQHAHKFVHKG